MPRTSPYFIGRDVCRNFVSLASMTAVALGASDTEPAPVIDAPAAMDVAAAPMSPPAIAARAMRVRGEVWGRPPVRTTGTWRNAITPDNSVAIDAEMPRSVLTNVLASVGWVRS